MTNNKILIVDDEVDIRFLLKRALKSNNYAVVEAGNLKEGLEIQQESQPDIIILDVNLPDGNGIYYARKFKNDKNMVIFISADNDKLSEGYLDAGADGFLKKPFVIGQLLALIDKIKPTIKTIN